MWYVITQHNGVAGDADKYAARVQSRMYDVIIVGGGVAGLSAATFTARADFETLVLDSEGPRPSDGRTQSGYSGESILRRNAHLENYPGFPAGVNARLLLDLMAEGADRAGAERRTAEVVRLTHDDGFAVETAAGDRYRAGAVIAATKNAVDYLPEGVEIVDRGKPFVAVDERGRTAIPGLYAAGRLAGKPHQAVVSAGHGAEVAVTLLEDADAPFYHDWVTPDGYFTDRGRDLPPGCEEIDDAERRRREDAARELMRDRFAEPHPSDQPTHPSLEE
jgi:thioredoxin reductase